MDRRRTGVAIVTLSRSRKHDMRQELWGSQERTRVVCSTTSGVRRGALSGGQDGIKCMQDYAAAVGHEVQMRVSLVELNEAYGFCATGGGQKGESESSVVRRLGVKLESLGM